MSQLRSFFFFFSMGCLIICTSCVNTKKAVYFNNISDTTLQLSLTGIEVPIQKADILNITVTDLNAEAMAVFNAPALVNITTTAGTNYMPSGYLVNQDGTIQFPVLGNIRVLGLTKKQLKDEIARQLIAKGQAKEPIVTIRHVNFKVTVLGEVNNPTVINVPNEQITLLEALGIAGDLTIYGKRENVLLIRDEGVNRIVRRINLNDRNTLISPYYFLKPNDAIYVEPNEARIASSSRSAQLLPTIFAAVSLGVVIFDRIFR